MSMTILVGHLQKSSLKIFVGIGLIRQVIPGYGHAVLRCPDPRFTAFINFGRDHIKNDDVFDIVNSLFDIAPKF